MKKNILITGSTDGIGKLAALRLANDGHVVYLHGRNEEKLNDTISEIKENTKNDNVFGFVADFSNLNVVKNMAEQIMKKIDRLDVIINNAGVFKTSATHSNEGLDLRFMVNYIAPFVLTNKLLPLLEQGTDSRVINLSSAAQSAISYDAMAGKQKISVNESYAQSKLALTIWNYHFANLHKNITAIAVNPGSLLNTKMVKEAYGQYWAPADKGADILYDLAIGEEHKKHSGEYFDNDSGVYAKAHGDTYNSNIVNNLIEFTNKLTD
ncbi:SDR family NAD(P)-dependent oxidoreductase [Ancylomarina euxinus]|uniref:SDR family NAD(P)-dependent oxidoreductase n=1 Tax=Ancylomarina euxinus TaxID=2283627 RepID=A0A425XWK8_9BACT|nr:SDR family NAD(P)-dependent oxidoreductase [Ancylomarina euxinus]MCZ4696401.1 SDR family NAD(P)-dependent oxidoreductase [Ancylomarina euxinus]RRG19020.1 SDR family NAD(P)-dependent oxidoreductase [Ancylomarina euxinus]